MNRHNLIRKESAYLKTADLFAIFDLLDIETLQMQGRDHQLQTSQKPVERETNAGIL